MVVATRTSLSRSQARAAIDEGRVWTDGVRARKASAKVDDGATVRVHLPAPTLPAAEAQDIAIDVVYEDDDVVVVNKAPGMVVHPGAGHADGTLVNALLHHCAGRLSGLGGELRPGIVHRLDRDTSGLLVVSKHDDIHRHLQAQFTARSVGREYIALVARTSGSPLPEQCRFDTAHGRHPSERKRFTGKRGTRRAVTHVRGMERFTHGGAYVACRLDTGRTHQIRMHLSEAGAPLLGDPLYGGRAVAGTSLITRTALHARALRFDTVAAGPLSFEVEPPPDFHGALEALRRGASWRK